MHQQKITPELLTNWGFEFSQGGCPEAWNHQLGVSYWHKNVFDETVESFWEDIIEELQLKYTPGAVDYHVPEDLTKNS